MAGLQLALGVWLAGRQRGVQVDLGGALPGGWPRRRPALGVPRGAGRVAATAGTGPLIRRQGWRWAGAIQGGGGVGVDVVAVLPSQPEAAASAVRSQVDCGCRIWRSTAAAVELAGKHLRSPAKPGDSDTARPARRLQRTTGSSAPGVHHRGVFQLPFTAAGPVTPPSEEQVRTILVIAPSGDHAGLITPGGICRALPAAVGCYRRDVARPGVCAAQNNWNGRRAGGPRTARYSS